jgi:integrase
LAQRVLGIPFKRARQRAIDYPECEEIDAILKTINRKSQQGSRDYALLATMFNTGARVQEIVDLRACDLQLTKPFQVRLFGKGKKGALLSAVAPDCCGAEDVLPSAESGPTIRISRISESPVPTDNAFRNPPYPGQMSRPGLRRRTKSPQEALASSQCAAQYGPGPSEIGR